METKLQLLNISTKQWVASLLVLAIFIILRYVFNKGVQGRNRLRTEDKRRLLLNFNSILTSAFILAEVSIWAHEIESMALSFAAISVAIAVGFKEIFLCLSGGFFRLFSGSFHIGDRIEVCGIRGDVVDRGPLSTTLLEVGPLERSHQYTGKSVVIPNSLFVGTTLKNESYLKNFVLHTFSIPLTRSPEWESEYNRIVEIVQTEAEPFKQEAQRYMDRMERKTSIVSPSSAPRVHVNIKTATELEVVIRVTVPAPKKREVEQQIIKSYLRSIVS